MLGEINKSSLNIREKFLVNILCSEVLRAYREGMPVKEIKEALNYFIQFIQFHLRSSRTHAPHPPSLPPPKGADPPQPPSSPRVKPPSFSQEGIPKTESKPLSPMSARSEVLDELKRLWSKRKKFVLLLE